MNCPYCQDEEYTGAEREILARHMTNLDRPVFALVHLPEVVKGALFARYSRSSKPLRRLFLDEFAGDLPQDGPVSTTSEESGRAGRLYDTVFVAYGDDSVAQLGGVHLACEGASNILTKVLEWGRLMSYLEQSTRYIPYTDRPGGRYRYVVPRELDDEPELRSRYVAVQDQAFDTYVHWLEPVRSFFAGRFPRQDTESASAHQRAVQSRALDALRGLLPAATRSNVGLYGTGQAYENLLLRMQAHPVGEVREYAELMLRELRKVVPAFMKRVDQPERGLAWSRYLADNARAMREVAASLLEGQDAEPRPAVVLSDFDPEGEVKVVAAALYAASHLPDEQLLARVRELSDVQRAEVLKAYVGQRTNRRHKPARAFERSHYRFDILSDYGSFRDLQRHRILTLEWQALSPRHGYVMPPEIAEVGAGDDWKSVMSRSASLHDALTEAGMESVASYAVSMAYRIRYYMDMNAREAMHIIELRTSPQGHPSYRAICQEMHRLIAEQAGHRALAEAMIFANHESDGLGRRQAEQAAEARGPKGS